MVVEPSSVRRRQHFQTTSPLKLQAEPFHISHIASTGGGKDYLCFYFDRIRTLVAMAT